MEQTFDSFVNTRVQLSQSIGDESRRRRERTNETDGDVDGYDEVMRFADRDAGCQTTVGRLFELGNVWAMGSVQWDHVLASRSITGLGAQFISAWKRFIPKTKETKSYRQQKNLLLLYRIEKKNREWKIKWKVKDIQVERDAPKRWSFDLSLGAPSIIMINSDECNTKWIGSRRYLNCHRARNQASRIQHSRHWTSFRWIKQVFISMMAFQSPTRQ